MLYCGVTLDFYFKSNGKSLENSKTIGYSGGYIVFNYYYVEL
jgi:hypothetical protein